MVVRAVAVQAGTGRVIDGVHRLHAAREAGLAEILAVEHQVADNDLRALAYRLNREHGVPYSREERDAIIARLYLEDGKTQSEIAEVTGLSQQAVSRVLQVKGTQAGEADKRIRLKDGDLPAVARLLLGGATHEEVAGNFGVSRSTVTTRWNEVRDAMRAEYEGGALKREVAAKHGLTEAEVDLVLRQFGDPLNFEPEYGSLWAGFRIDERFGQRHPGNLPAALVRNLLCFYSRPGDVILDPFCGGGVVLDVARDMVDRTAYGFDLDPRRPDVAKWDITGGPPPVPRAPDLVFLDPPYAGMKKGQYSGHPSELSEMSVEGFLDTMEHIFGYWDRGRLILVMGCLRREGEFVALPYECARRMEGKGWRLADWVVNQVHRPASESGITVAMQRRQRVVMRMHVDVVLGEKGSPGRT